MRKFGIDISCWQTGYPYKSVDKEGVEFAIIRAGYRTIKDTVFETHYSNAKKLGWGVGAYWYMYATSVEGAKAEARAFLDAVKGKQFEYPLYLDLEDSSIKGLGSEKLEAMVRAFGEIIEGAGYYFGVYTNLHWYRNIIDGKKLNKKYDWWIAAWSENFPQGVDAGLWQFGGSTNLIRNPQLAGFVTDQDYALKDYPAIMKAGGLNGFNKPETKPAKKSIDEIVQEVLDNKWGIYPERKTRLEAAGYNFEEIQNKINKIYKNKKEIKVGDHVRVRNNVIYGTDKAFAVYYSSYEVMEANGDRLVIGINGTVTTAIDKSNVEKI